MKRVALTALIAGCGNTSAPVSGTWSTVDVGAAGALLSSVHGSGPRDIWIAGGSVGDTCQNNGSFVIRGDGTTWTPQTMVGHAVWAFAVDDAWIDDFTLSEHWDGNAWSGFRLNDNRAICTFWGNGPHDLWGTEPDPGYLGHFDGTAWQHVINIDGRSLWGTGTDMWAIDAGNVLHWQGAAVPPAAAPRSYELVSTSLEALSGIAVDDVWAAGDGGVLAHRDSHGWSNVDSPTTATIHGLASIAHDDAWAIGDGGTLLHFDGTEWAQVASPTSNALHAVWAATDGEVWVVGDSGTVLHYVR